MITLSGEPVCSGSTQTQIKQETYFTLVDLILFSQIKVTPNKASQIGREFWFVSIALEMCAESGFKATSDQTNPKLK